MTDLSPVLDRADKNIEQSLERLFDLVRIKSISTDPAYKADCRQAAEWLVATLTEIGFDASMPGYGRPSHGGCASRWRYGRLTPRSVLRSLRRPARRPYRALGE
ncbi:acetylornithine deacetylase/succinyl-diaminopimelate desuccinylase-like protein [Pseudorhizobium tarimense]|uniref:Acetylornithine deacetylase/succinyl-diaminopimelate desuccinylase-like protein n=1 Tax=Pseudorhizobium tarimense TaxID=1079109 RepID=A0ABV2H1W1_9HYPH